MIRIARLLSERKMQSRMLLQVHDELVFESPSEETSDLKTLVKTEMERVYPTNVPLLVELGAGPNWRDAK
jgi:DNA polymerase I